MNDIKHIGNIIIYPKDSAMHGALDIRLRKGYLCVRFPQKNYPFYMYYSENATPSKAKWVIGNP